jgi:hypothetical protein
MGCGIKNDLAKKGAPEKFIDLHLKVFIIKNMRVGIGTSKAQDYQSAIKESIEKARASMSSEKINLALMFGTERFNSPQALETITTLLGPIPLLGAYSNAIISGQTTLKHGIIIMLFSVSEGGYINTASIKDVANKDAFASGTELGTKLLQGNINTRRNLSIILSGTDKINNTSFLSGLQEKLGKSFPIIGGSITSELDPKNYPLFCNQERLRDAAWGILWGGKLNFSLTIKHSWQPLGKPRCVTMASGNIVNEIDNEPAADLYKEYFSMNAEELNKSIKHLSASYPLGIRIENNEFIIRSAVALRKDGSLVFTGDVPEGSIVRLMISSKQSCLNSAKEAAETVLKNMGAKKIKLVLILNSLSRYIVLGRQAGREISIIKETLGEDVPIAGLYTSTEEAPTNTINYLGRTYIHNNSLVMLTIAD